MLFALDNFVDVTGGQMNIFWVKIAHRHNFFDLNDASASSCCHIRIKIARTFAKLNISFSVRSLPFHKAKIAPN